ncbi:hypothetical protein RIF29_19338 [Crotalaria pallida]|uniref:Uncharacterized protein n=1 Tax=Crotalaria pallida TaxID=3830 RepID=A0AAN9F7M4_CROPI
MLSHYCLVPFAQQSFCTFKIANLTLNLNPPSSSLFFLTIILNLTSICPQLISSLFSRSTIINSFSLDLN